MPHPHLQTSPDYPRRDLPGYRIRHADRSSRGSCRRFGFEMGCLVCAPADDRSLLLKPYGKVPLCLLRFALAEDFGHEGRAARADHEADAAQHHDKRHHEVDGREWRLAGEVRHEEAVYYAVDRREDHHHDRRQHEAQQLLIRKMVRKLNLRLFHLYVQPCSAAIPPFFGYALDCLAFTQPLLQQAAE